jgi:hypothetical protein
MRIIKRIAPRSIAFVALLTSLVVTTGAIAQERQPTELDGDRWVRDEPDGRGPDPLRPSTSSAASGEAIKLPPGPRGRPFMAGLFAVPLMTYAGPVGSRGSEIVSPADRFATAQLIGFGYVVNPQFRFGLMGIFNEALTSVPRGADAWQFGGVAPIAIGTLNHLIIGGGPIIGYRSGGKRQTDFGAVVLSGASIPLRKGLALNLAAPVTALFTHRITVSVGVAVGVAKVF